MYGADVLGSIMDEDCLWNLNSLPTPLRFYKYFREGLKNHNI
ncbi:MAG: hypothetical protein ACK52J_01105 [bacterium]